MRVFLKVFFHVTALAALRWLLPQIGASFERATVAGPAHDAARGHALFALHLVVGAGLGIAMARDVSSLCGDLAGSPFVGGGRLPAVTPAPWMADRPRKQGKPPPCWVACLNSFRTRLPPGRHRANGRG
jgi:hypothetical protein